MGKAITIGVQNIKEYLQAELSACGNGSKTKMTRIGG